MNCEGYILWSDTNSKCNYFLQNTDKSIFTDIWTKYTDDNILVIKRVDSMIYYIYMRTLSDKPHARIGLAVGLNMTIVTDIAALHHFFNKTMRSIAHSYGIAQYNKTMGVYSRSNAKQDLVGARKHLCHRFNNFFNEKGALTNAISHIKHRPEDFLTINKDKSVTRFVTRESPAAGQSVFSAIEEGNVVIVSSEISDEQELAIATRKVFYLEQKNNELTTKNEQLQTKITTLEKAIENRLNQLDRKNKIIDNLQSIIKSHESTATNKSDIKRQSAPDTSATKHKSIFPFLSCIASFTILIWIYIVYDSRYHLLCLYDHMSVVSSTGMSEIIGLLVCYGLILGSIRHNSFKAFSCGVTTCILLIIALLFFKHFFPELIPHLHIRDYDMMTASVLIITSALIGDLFVYIYRECKHKPTLVPLLGWGGIIIGFPFYALISVFFPSKKK